MPDMFGGGNQGMQDMMSKPNEMYGGGQPMQESPQKRVY